MKTPYEIELWEMATDKEKLVEVTRIDALFSKIEARYWKWREDVHRKGVEMFTSKNIMSREEAETFFDKQHEGEVKDLVRVFETLNAHYTRLYPYVQEFNNTKIRVAIAEDKSQYKGFCTGLKTASKIAIKYKDKLISEITIWYGKKHCSSLSGIVNGYILEDITNRFPPPPYSSVELSYSFGDEPFEEIRSIIQEETSKHHFADQERNTPKSDLQPLTERCSDLYSDIMKHKKWIVDKTPARGSDSVQVGKIIIKLLGLKFSTEKGLNKETTFINALHPIHYKEDHSLSDIIDLEW